jgi:hypothetical protein
VKRTHTTRDFSLRTRGMAQGEVADMSKASAYDRHIRSKILRRDERLSLAERERLAWEVEQGGTRGEAS